MPNAKKPRPETRSITFKDVPTEYVELIEDLAFWFARTDTQEYTEPKASPDMPKAEVKTLMLCEVFHERHERKLGAGSTQEKLERHRYDRKLHNQSLSPDNV